MWSGVREQSRKDGQSCPRSLWLLVAGVAFRSYLGSNLRTLGYAPMKADPDLWMRSAVKPDGTEYYEYLLAYVDDLCGMSMDTKHMFHSIGKLFKLKKESVSPIAK